MRHQLTREDENRKIDLALQSKRLKEEHALQESQWKLRDAEHKKYVDHLKVRPLSDRALFLIRF